MWPHGVTADTLQRQFLSLWRLGSIQRSFHKSQKAMFPWLQLRALNSVSLGDGSVSLLPALSPQRRSSTKHSVKHTADNCTTRLHCWLQVKNVGEGNALMLKCLNWFQGADGTSCWSWNNRKNFHINYYLISCTHAGAEKRFQLPPAVFS